MVEDFLVNAAVIALLIGQLGSPDFKVREAATDLLCSRRPTVDQWLAVRRLNPPSPEAASRLRRVDRNWTAKIADDLLPPDALWWPSAERVRYVLPERTCQFDWEDPKEWPPDEWWVWQTGYYDNYCGDQYPYTDPRQALKDATIRYLSYTEDVDRIRKVLADAHQPTPVLDLLGALTDAPDCVRLRLRPDPGCYCLLGVVGLR